jgi:Cu+-exporting ATPase
MRAPVDEMIKFFAGIQGGGIMKVIDPVCKMTIDAEKAAATSEYKGQTIYFCAQGCKAKFDAAPDKYAGK